MTEDKKVQKALFYQLFRTKKEPLRLIPNHNGSSMRITGLEPALLAKTAPKTVVSANSTISAFPITDHKRYQSIAESISSNTIPFCRKNVKYSFLSAPKQQHNCYCSE